MYVVFQFIKIFNFSDISMGKPKAKPKRGSAKGSEKVVSKNITNKHDINTILDKVYFVIYYILSNGLFCVDSIVFVYRTETQPKVRLRRSDIRWMIKHQFFVHS